MFNVLIKLQRKPEPLRRQIAFVSALSLTAVIALLWLVSLSAPNDGAKTAAGTEPQDGPFSAVVDALGSFTSDASAMFGELRQGLRGASTVYPEDTPQ